MEQFRTRLVELRSLNDIRQLSQELAEFELSEPVALPFLVVRSILRDLFAQLSDRPLEPQTWRQVQDALGDPIERVIDAYTAHDPAALFERLNALTRRWAHTRRELTE